MHRSLCPAVLLLNVRGAAALTSAERSEILSMHNQWRQAHGAGDLTYDTSLENLAAESSPGGTFSDAIHGWYSEVEYWNYNTCSGNGGGATGHFTQV
eukprot:gene45241-37609_t